MAKLYHNPETTTDTVVFFRSLLLMDLKAAELEEKDMSNLNLQRQTWLAIGKQEVLKKLLKELD